jgi:hypothetical protein
MFARCADGATGSWITDMAYPRAPFSWRLSRNSRKGKKGEKKEKQERGRWSNHASGQQQNIESVCWMCREVPLISEPPEILDPEEQVKQVKERNFESEIGLQFTKKVLGLAR